MCCEGHIDRYSFSEENRVNEDFTDSQNIKIETDTVNEIQFETIELNKGLKHKIRLISDYGSGFLLGISRDDPYPEGNLRLITNSEFDYYDYDLIFQLYRLPQKYEN